jgi:kynurenine formamidase
VAFLGTDKNDGKLYFPGVGLSAAKFLANERFVYGVGVDTVSVDPGYSDVRRKPFVCS